MKIAIMLLFLAVVIASSLYELCRNVVAGWNFIKWLESRKEKRK